MKRVLPYLLLLFLSGEIHHTYSWDSTAAKFMPLQVGNFWVYNFVGTGNSSKSKLKIVNEFIENGHKYFVFEQTGDTCKCSFNSFSPFLIQLKPVRVDSISGNFMLHGTSCQWQIGEKLLDSLSAKVGDNPNNPCNQNVCVDTSMQNVFGVMRKTKRMGFPIMTYYQFRTYSHGLGLISSTMGCYAGTTCVYTLAGCVVDGVVYGDTDFVTGINQISSEIPVEFSLSQNYPNPFNPSTKLKFQIPLTIGVDAIGGRGVLSKLSIYNSLGHEVAVLVNQSLQPGTYEVDWDASNYPSGVYFYELTSGDFTQTKKMVLLK